MTAPTLQEVQRWMRARIRPAAIPKTPAADSILNPQRGTPGIDRLAVYANGYLARAQEALQEVYETIAQVLGDDAFRELASAYALAQPSHEYNLSFFGRHLPEFLRASPLTAQLPFLPDLARLEWQVCQAFHAAEQPPIDRTTLASLVTADGERVRLVFQPSVGVVSSAWPIADLWQARQQPRTAINIGVTDRPQSVLVSKREQHVRCELVEAPAARLLTGLLQGRTLGEVSAELAHESWASGAPIGEWFSGWIRAGLVIRWELT